MASFWEPFSELYSVIALDLYKNILIATVTLLIGFVVGKILGKLVERFLDELDLNKFFRKFDVRISMSELVGILVTYVIYAIAIASALKQLHLTSTVLSVIQAILLLALVVSILLGLKDFLPNLFAGFFIASSAIIKVGDYIKVNSAEGQVIRRGLVETLIQTKQGDVIYIPNASLIKQEIVKLRHHAK